MKHKVIYLLFVFTLINLNHADAFFLINDHAEKIKIDPTIIDGLTQENNLFQLYDNFFYNHTHNFLIKKKEGFIAADQVDLNMPLKILARDSIYIENSLDRLLLANLRIKNLILKYAQLQKKVWLILDHDTKVGIGKSKDRKVYNREAADGESIENEKIILNERLFNINRLSKITQDDISIGETIYIENYSRLKNNSGSSLKSISYFAESTAGIDNTTNLTKTTFNTTRESIGGQEDKKLPWVIRFFLEILKYIVNNLVEMTLYFLFIAFVALFISLRLRR